LLTLIVLESFSRMWASYLTPQVQLKLAKEDFEISGLDNATDIFPPADATSIRQDIEVLLEGAESCCFTCG